jgi:hypothetical protein
MANFDSILRAPLLEKTLQKFSNFCNENQWLVLLVTFFVTLLTVQTTIKVFDSKQV